MPYRKTAIRHPLARVRSIIREDQRFIARRAGCSVVAIKRIEQGTLAMSRAIAEKLEAALGVSAAYLRHGKASKTPTTPTGEPFTADTFDCRKAELRAGTLIQSAAFFPFRWAARLGAIAQSAGEQNKMLAFHYKVEALALELEKQFGVAKGAEPFFRKLCSEAHENQPDKHLDLLRVGVHDDKMPFKTFLQLAQKEGLPYKATAKTSTVEEHEAAQAKAAGLTVRQYRKKKASEFARWEKKQGARLASSPRIKRRRQGKG